MKKNETDKYSVFIKKIFLICAFMVALMESASAGGTQNSSTNISVYVTVSEITMVSITPTILNWTGVSPGSEGVATAVEVEDIGSTNITKVWFSNSYPASLPYGSQNVYLHDAGNFLVIKKNQSGQLWYHPELVEYNESQLIYLVLPAAVKSHGRFRDAQSEYFWALANDSAGNCTNGTFYIGVVPHNSTQTGSVDLTACALSLTQTGLTGCRSGQLTKYNTSYGYADVMVGRDDGGATQAGLNYSMMVSQDCTQVNFYHWDQDMPPASSTVNDEYFANSTIYPGGNIIANINVRVPYGVPSGTKTGSLTVLVQAITVS